MTRSALTYGHEPASNAITYTANKDFGISGWLGLASVLWTVLFLANEPFRDFNAALICSFDTEAAWPECATWRSNGESGNNAPNPTRRSIPGNPSFTTSQPPQYTLTPYSPSPIWKQHSDNMKKEFLSRPDYSSFTLQPPPGMPQLAPSPKGTQTTKCHTEEHYITGEEMISCTTTGS
jgi:hypothetical protein